MNPQIWSLPAYWPGVSIKTKKRVRHTISDACAACRRSKVKCDDTKPCSRCIKHDWQDKCVTWRHLPPVMSHAETAAAVEGEPSPEPGSPIGASSAQKRRRTISTSTACNACRISKVKCDEQKPCKRCIKTSRQTECVGWRRLLTIPDAGARATDQSISAAPFALYEGRAGATATLVPAPAPAIMPVRDILETSLSEHALGAAHALRLKMTSQACKRSEEIAQGLVLESKSLFESSDSDTWSSSEPNSAASSMFADSSKHLMWLEQQEFAFCSPQHFDSLEWAV